MKTDYKVSAEGFVSADIAWSLRWVPCVAFALLCVGCADDTPEPERGDMAAVEDVGEVDFGVDQDSTIDVGSDADSEDEKCPLFGSCSCRRNEECARGAVCQAQGSICTTVTGCTLFPNDPEDRGCYYDHDQPLVPYAGYFTYAECESDEECADERPHCIDRVCHVSSPCEDDEDCPEGQGCYLSRVCGDEDRL